MSRDDIRALIEKANESLVVARDLLRGSHDSLLCVSGAGMLENVPAPFFAAREE